MILPIFLSVYTDLEIITSIRSIFQPFFITVRLHFLKNKGLSIFLIKFLVIKKTRNL